MIKNLFLSLIKPTKTPETVDNKYKVLLPKLPFYGIGGTICRVEEAPESYYKVLYNSDGTINPQKIPVPKNKNKNYDLILNDYCKDLKNYLDKFQNQYLEYENSINKPTLTNKQFYILAAVTSLATIASIPFLLSTAWTGLLFTAISTLFLYIVCDIRKKDIKNNNQRNNFKKKYKQYKRALANYRSGNPMFEDKIIETTYTEFKKIDKSYLKIFPKIKILVKPKIKEAA